MSIAENDTRTGALVEVCTCAVAIHHPGGWRVSTCPEPQVAVCDVPMQRGETVELALCAEHLRLLRDSADPIHVSRKWLP